MKRLIIITIFAVIGLQGYSQSTEVPFTLEDRDRIIKLEEKINSNNGKIESLRNEMNAKFEAVDSKIETIYWGLGVIITLMLFMLGYMIWDRRTALHPVQMKSQEHEERLRKLEYITKEQAKKDPAFAELLRISGLL